MQLVGTVESARAGKGRGVRILGAALGGEQVVPAVALVNVRTFDQCAPGALEDVLHRTDERPRLQTKLLEQDASEAVVLLPMVPYHVEQPLAAIVVMEERWVESAAVQEDRLGPRAFDRWRGDEVVVGD